MSFAASPRATVSELRSQNQLENKKSRLIHHLARSKWAHLHPAPHPGLPHCWPSDPTSRSGAAASFSGTAAARALHCQLIDAIDGTSEFEVPVSRLDYLALTRVLDLVLTLGVSRERSLRMRHSKRLKTGRDSAVHVTCVHLPCAPQRVRVHFIVT